MVLRGGTGERAHCLTTIALLLRVGARCMILKVAHRHGVTAVGSFGMGCICRLCHCDCGAVPVVDYAALRAAAQAALTAKAASVRQDVAKLQKAQRAAEAALDMYQRECAQ